jgi:hypothetical protein
MMKMQTRYFHVKGKVKWFIPLQLGLCAFKLAGKKMLYSPFNIYLYPQAVAEK